jgi:hypothetical protein
MMWSEKKTKKKKNKNKKKKPKKKINPWNPCDGNVAPRVFKKSHSTMGLNY